MNNQITAPIKKMNIKFKSITFLVAINNYAYIIEFINSIQ